MQDVDRSIEGGAKTIAEVLENKKYSIDYYQREYKWEEKQLAELVNDLSAKFLDLYSSNHTRRDVSNYPGYFLGSIIVSKKASDSFIVDGQQRLTSLTLILTYLRRLQIGRGQVVDIDQLIFSEKFGEKSFNLNVPDRVECMESLFDVGEYDPPADAAESVRTLANRYSEIDQLFPDDVKGDALPFFIDWLKDRVQLVQITAYTDDDAYAIFETMNDRGLKLTPADMLKGYLLANMEEGHPRTKANDVWRKRLLALNSQAEDAGADFLKTWLRSQYATKIRQGRAGSGRPEDWDRIGTEFHRWLRDARERIGLSRKEDFFEFVRHDMEFFGRQYERIVTAADGPLDPESPLRFIRYNHDNRFTLQGQLLLAPLRPDDPTPVIDRKLELVGRFVDILHAWRVWNYRSTGYSVLKVAMFGVMRDIRALGAQELATTLHSYLMSVDETFDHNDELSVHQQNSGQIHKVLARITDWVTLESGQAGLYDELTNRGKVRYEIEHIWANQPTRHAAEFSHEADFRRHRNRIGGLLLLPKQFNASYRDDKYEKKLPHYFGQNILAASLSPLSYQNNPGFLSLAQRTGLPFRPYEEFLAADLVDRGNLYREIAKKVWNPGDLLAVADESD